MNNFLATLREGLSRIRRVWIITAVVILGLVLGTTAVASGAIRNVLAALPGNNPAVAAVNYQAPGTATMAPMPGMPGMPGMETPTAMPAMPGMPAMETPTPMQDMPGMVMPTMVPGYGQPPASGDLDALAQQMQSMMQSLNGVMGQLEQKGSQAYVMPTATPVAVDLQAIMTEMESINQTMGPLMLRIQADLQGNPSAEELASVRAQVQQINMRIGNLLGQLQAARGDTMPGMDMSGSMATMPGMAATPTMVPMPGMGSMPGMGQASPAQDKMAQLDQMLEQMQAMLHEMQSGGASSHPTPMAGMSSSGSMPGMGQKPSMDDMMKKMDEMMAKMDGMMGKGGMSGSMGGSNMPGMNMPGMPAADPSMKMMDNMMSMMDNMMMMMQKMMDMDMMGMPDM